MIMYVHTKLLLGFLCKFVKFILSQLFIQYKNALHISVSHREKESKELGVKNLDFS